MTHLLHATLEEVVELHALVHVNVELDIGSLTPSCLWSGTKGELCMSARVRFLAPTAIAAIGEVDDSIQPKH